MSFGPGHDLEGDRVAAPVLRGRPGEELVERLRHPPAFPGPHAFDGAHVLERCETAHCSPPLGPAWLPVVHPGQIGEKARSRKRGSRRKRNVRGSLGRQTFGELEPGEARVEPALRHERVMRAFGDDAAVVEDEDAVGLLHGREPVGHDEHRAAVGQPVHRLLHQPFAFGVERGGRLVQQQDRRVAQDRAGDGDALLLPAREHHAAFAHVGVVALRERGEEVVRGGGAGGLLDLGVGRAGAAEADVLARGGGEDHRVLRHERKRPAEVRPRHVAQVDPVEQDAPRGRVEEPLDQLDHGRLARARGADKRHRLSGPDVEGHAVQRLVLGPRGVAEDHVLERHAALERHRRGDRRSGVLHAVGGAEELGETFGRAGGALKLAPDLGERRDAARHHDRVDDELDELAHAHRVGPHVPRAYPEDAHDAGEDQRDDDDRHDARG